MNEFSSLLIPFLSLSPSLPFPCPHCREAVPSKPIGALGSAVSSPPPRGAWSGASAEIEFGAV